jgi:hypothetical protein
MHWGALRRIIVTGECLVHSNHILFLGISLLEWQWGHDVADVESGLRPFKTLGGGLEAAIVTILTHTNAAWDLRS